MIVERFPKALVFYKTGTLTPGMGCDRKQSDTLSSELKRRIKQHGDAMQLTLSERSNKKAEMINQKLDLIYDRLKEAPHRNVILDRDPRA